MKLLPFSQSNSICSVSAEMVYKNHSLELTFQLSDPESNIADVEPVTLSLAEWKRRPELWKTTCFEAFWALPKSNKYWEFNFSPRGFWNLYCFESYRHPQPPKECSDFSLKDISLTKNLFRIELGHALSSSEVQGSLCAIVRMKTNEIIYFSNQHTSDKPDFHRREAFTLKRCNV